LLADEQVSSVSVEGDVLWALTDRMGSVRDVVDSSGQLRLHRDFDAFGNVVGETHYNASGQEVTSGTGFVTVAFAFTGRLWDDETKLQNNLNRWYDPATGSWISEDPIGFLAGDANLNRYVGNEPTGYIDPLGLQSGDDGGNGYGGGTPGGNDEDDWRKIRRRLAESDPWWNDSWRDWLYPWSWTASWGDAIGDFLSAATLIDSDFESNRRLGEQAIRSGRDFREHQRIGKFSETVIEKAAEQAFAFEAAGGAGLGAARQRAVRHAWAQERAFVRRYGYGTRDWTDAQMRELLSTGRVRGYQGHHINSVKGHSELAGNPDNVRFVTRQENLRLHDGDWRNPTTGPLIDRGQ
jgi:RHS repeat-associated protein